MTKSRSAPSETREWQDGRTLVPKWSQGSKLLLQPRSNLNFWFWGLWYSSLAFTTTNNQDYKIISWDLWIIFSIKMLWFSPNLVQITFAFIISLNLYTLIKVQAYCHWLGGNTYCNRGTKVIKMNKEDVHIYVLPDDRGKL